MKRKNTTRNALFTSIMSLLLCVSMLVGTTFAWFTDSVESGRNLIAAGNLDVELYHSDKDETGVEVKSSTELFNDVVLWEPGAVLYDTLQVKNVGNLALKYNLDLTVLNETEIGGHKLSEVIKVGVINSALGTGTTRDGIIGAVTTWEPLSTFSMNQYGIELEVGGDDIFTVVLYWAPNSNDYDNQFNMNNQNRLDGNVLQLEIGVNLYATQVEAEFDSFGDDYDDGAYLLPVVSDGAELASALANGESVKLGADVAQAETIMVPAGEEVILDLNGYALTGNIEIAEGAELTVNNGTIINTDSAASGIQNNGGELVLNNVDITSARHGVRVEGGTVTIDGGTYEASGTSGMTQHALNVSDGATVTINGGTFIGPKGTGSDSGAAVNVQAGSTVIINGGSFSGGLNNTLASKGTLTVKGGSFDQDPSDYVAEYYTAADNGDGTWTVGVSNEDLSNMISDAQPGDTVTVPAGTYTFPATSLKEGVTLNCAEGTVFEGTSSLNINGATVVGGTFSNNDGSAVSQTINGTFKDCTFTGSNALRWCYAGETVVFENCVFDGSTYGAHFDGGANDIIFKDCTFSGFNAFGGAVTQLTLENCTFKANGKSNYNGANLWGNTTLTNCTFVFDGSVANEWVDLCGDGKTVTFTGCVVTDGTTEKGIETVVGDYGDGNTIIVDGKTRVSDGLYTDVDGNYDVYNATGLNSLKTWMDSHSNNAFWGKTYNIMADIDASNVTWNTKFISPDSTTFDGITLNGNGHTISDLTINGQGLFSGATKGSTSSVPATFKDITFDNVTVNGGSHHNGVVWGEAYGDITLDNVSVINSKVTGGCNVGALVGRNFDHSVVKFINCSVKNTTVEATKAADYAGASAFLGMALKIADTTSINLVFEGTNVSEGNTLTTAEGMQGGGIYTTAEWDTATWETPVVVDTFTNYNSNN